MLHWQQSTKRIRKSQKQCPSNNRDRNRITGRQVCLNHDKYTSDMPVVSNASCTTNCLAPICKVLEDNYGIEYGADVNDSCRNCKTKGCGQPFPERLENRTSGILDYVEDEVVSSDFIGDSHASIFDARQGIQVNSHFFKVICFYDNEWGYTSQIFRLIEHMDRIDHNR